MQRAFFIVLIPIVIAGCRIPRDADGTQERVQNGVLRVGVVPNAPWTDIESGNVTGVEADLVRQLAAENHARIEWVGGTEHDLVEQLKERQIDLVIGGLHAKLPWARTVAFTRPFFTDTTTTPKPSPRKHVLAVAPGENGWLMTVERFLFHKRDDVERRVRGQL